MRLHGDAILRLYGMARGRGAEYWGEHNLASDRLLHRLGHRPVPVGQRERHAADQPAPALGAALHAVH